MGNEAQRQKPANAVKLYEIRQVDLPACCPMEGMTQWDSHPRIFLNIEAKGYAVCPYCGAEYRLKVD